MKSWESCCSQLFRSNCDYSKWEHLRDPTPRPPLLSAWEEFIRLLQPPPMSSFTNTGQQHESKGEMEPRPQDLFLYMPVGLPCQKDSWAILGIGCFKRESVEKLLKTHLLWQIFLLHWLKYWKSLAYLRHPTEKLACLRTDDIWSSVYEMTTHLEMETQQSEGFFSWGNASIAAVFPQECTTLIHLPRLNVCKCLILYTQKDWDVSGCRPILVFAVGGVESPVNQMTVMGDSDATKKAIRHSCGILKTHEQKRHDRWHRLSHFYWGGQVVKLSRHLLCF